MNFKERMKITASNVGNGMKKHKKGIVIGISIVLVIALFFTALYFTGVFDDRANAIIELEAPTLTCHESGSVFGSEGYSVEIKGRIRNNIHATINFISFRFELYDANGNLVTLSDGSPVYATDTVQKLGGGKEYAYTATVVVPKNTAMPLTFKTAKTNLDL